MVAAFPSTKDAAFEALEVSDPAARSQLRSMVDLITLKAGAEVPASGGLFVLFEGSVRTVDERGSSTMLQAPCVLDASECSLSDGSTIVVASEDVTALVFDPTARALLFSSAPRVNALALDSARLRRLFRH